MKSKILLIFFLQSMYCKGQNIYFPSSYYNSQQNLEKNIVLISNDVLKKLPNEAVFEKYIYKISLALLNKDYSSIVSTLDSLRSLLPAQYDYRKPSLGIDFESFAKAKMAEKKGDIFNDVYRATLLSLLRPLKGKSLYIVTEFFVTDTASRKRELDKLLAGFSKSDSIPIFDALDISIYYSRWYLATQIDAMAIPILKQVEVENNILRGISSGGVLDPIQENMDIKHYTIKVATDIENESIRGSTTIKLILKKPTKKLLFDLVRLYKIESVVVDNNKAVFKHDTDKVFINSSQELKAGLHFITFNYSGKPPIATNPPWQGGFSWEKDENGKPWIAINCQSEGAKLYFPCKDHPSDEADEGADLYVTVPNNLSVAAFGLLQNVTPKANQQSTWHWKTNYTIANYSLLFNIGDYRVYKDSYTTIKGNKVPIELYIHVSDTAQAKRIIDIRKRDAAILEKYFGEYPWVKEKIGIGETPGTGMEHQTMITFGKQDLIKPTDSAYDYFYIFYHEFAHEWWANKITNKDWADMWIQEGITTYSEALFYREKAGEEGYHKLIRRIRSYIKNTLPIVKGTGLNSIEVYNGDIYDKGAFFMHSLRFALGDTIFFATLKKFIENVSYPYNQFFDTDDVEQFFSKESGKNLKPFFDFYLRTTKYFEFNQKPSKQNEYEISCSNCPITLPLEVKTDTGTLTLTINSDKSVLIQSATIPVIDPNGWYFTKQ